MNDHITRALTEDGIELKEAVHSTTDSEGPKTYFRGKQLIDVIWYTPDLELSSAGYRAV